MAEKPSIPASSPNPKKTGTAPRLIRKGFLAAFFLFTAIAILGLFLSMGRIIFMKIEHPISTPDKVAE